MTNREIDALVAEKVMGLKVECNVWDTRTQDELTPRYEFGIREPDGQVRGWLVRYSTDISAAWQVVEKLRETGWLVTVKSMPPAASFILEGSRSEYDAPCPDKLVGKGKCVCDLYWAVAEGYRHGEFIIADTAPMAISLAALKAVGVEVTEARG